MGKKVRTNIYVDSEILKEAQEIGLNVSKTCENALKKAIERLSSPKTETNGEICYVNEQKRGVWDLNPRGLLGHRLSRPAPYQARATPQNFP